MKLYAVFSRGARGNCLIRLTQYLPFTPGVSKVRPAGKIRLVKIFYPARGVLFKNIYTHFEPQLDKIISEMPQLHVLILIKTYK